jgi:hypothetical protein
MKRITIADIADTEAVKRAQEFGIDLTLTNQNLSLTPTERLRKLQQAANSMRNMREAFKNH